MHNTRQSGFTLVEMMIVVAIIGIIAAVVYPSYQRHVISTKRTDAMAFLQSEASSLESKKITMGSYANIPTANLPSGVYPRGSSGNTKLYDITTTLGNSTANPTGGWVITATPNTSGQMAQDGRLTLAANGRKCRDKNNNGNTTDAGECGVGNEWRD